MSEGGPRRAQLLAAALMVAAVTLFTGLDAVLKSLAARHDPLFLAFGRNVVQVGFVVAMLPWIGVRRTLRVRRPGIHLARGVLLLAGSFFVIESLVRLPMAQTYSVAFSAPLLAAGLAAAFLGERPTARQAGLIAAGFAGVLITLEPAAPSFGPALLFPLGLAVANAIFHVVTRAGGRDLDPYAMLLYGAAVAAALAALALPWTASAMSGGEVALLAAGGALGTAGQLCLVQAFRLAPTAIVSPMIYVQVISAGLVGFFAFGEIPSFATLAGAAVVAISGVLLVRSPPAPAVR